MCVIFLFLPLSSATDQSEGGNNTIYEILFDEEFLGGLTLRSSPNRAYRLPASCLLNLSFGKRLYDSEQVQKNSSQYKSAADYSTVASESGPWSQINHVENYAEDYLSNPRRDNRHVGRGHMPLVGAGPGVSPGKGCPPASGITKQYDRYVNADYKVLFFPKRKLNIK